MELYVSPQGRVDWSGLLPEPNAAGTDGPLNSISIARDQVREHARLGFLNEPATINVRKGKYRLQKPLTFSQADNYPLTIQAYKDEEVILNGSLKIENWEEKEINGTTMWVADVSTILARYGKFQSLFVNGKRSQRCRYPKEGFLTIKDIPGIGDDHLYADATSYFEFADGDLLKEWTSLENAEVLVKHFWIEERLPVERIDWEKKRLYFKRSSIFVMRSAFGPELADYFVENIFETCSEPGEWFLDTDTELLYYVPLAGETIADSTVEAPVLKELVRIYGNPEENRLAEHITFKNLIFENTDWEQDTTWDKLYDPCETKENWKYDATYRVPGAHRDPLRERANVPQAAINVPGAIALRGARHITIQDCTLRHIGFYGINIGEGCRAIRVIGNELHDLGAGGVKISGGDHTMPRNLRTGGNLISDNHIHDGGLIFFAACGVAIATAAENSVIWNHIHDMYYTGISCGWIWGYTEGVARYNDISHNHIHHLGKGYINDMGAIYMLGVQPGTKITHNHIHHVESQHYGGWGIYLDEGSSHMLVENNLVHDTQCGAYNQHWGRENIITNNILAFSHEGICSFAAGESHISFRFERNIMLSENEAPYFGGYDARLETNVIFTDYNLIWDNRTDLNKSDSIFTRIKDGTMTKEEWHKHGRDRHSIIADPLFVDPENGNYDLREGSPAFELGFIPFNIRNFGPRTKAYRTFELPYNRNRYDIYREME